MEYPHINDTKFPNLNTVDVYQFENDFEYARYTGKVAVKLCNVLWNSNYADVVKFEDDTARDIWFDNLSGVVKTLESGFVFAPELSLRIPIPYMDAYRYNYLVVKVPIITSANNPVDYENENERIETWYFFIDSMTRYATNTTELYLTLDVWTQFINTVDIPYLMLERGHAPMTQTSVENYLANPIANNEYLLAPDFNFGADSIIQTSNYVPIGNGEKYVLFCAPFDNDHFNEFGGVAWSGNSTPASYSDTSERWGHQLNVSNYEWKFDSADYSSAGMYIENSNQTGLFAGCECFAILAQDAKAFFNDCARNCVQFIHGIQAMFILDGDLFTRSEPTQFRGFTIYIADRKQITTNFTLNKQQFGFDSNYDDIAKLYTFPYSELEITDDNGHSFTAKVENTGNIKMIQEVALVYPFLNYNVLFAGINGDGSMQYQWQVVQGETRTRDIWASDFSKFMMNWDIPVYGLFVSSENEYAANNFAGVEAKRQRAIMDYKNAMRYGNTTRENVADSMQTNTNNVAANGQTNKLNTQRTTAKNVANVAKDVVMNDDIGARENLRDTRLKNISNTLIDTTTQTSIDRLLNDAAVDLLVINAGVVTNAQNVALTAVGGTVGSIVSGGISGGGMGAASGAVSGIMNGVSAAIGWGIDAQYAQVQQAALQNKVLRLAGDKRYGTGGIDEIRDANKLSNTNHTNENNDARYGQDDSIIEYRNVNMTQKIAADKVAADANAEDLRVTNNANATRTQTTETNNATYNRNALEQAEKAKMAQAQLEAESDYKNARLHAPAMYAKYGGDYAPDVYQRRGVRFNVRTQPKSAIKQAGDAFLRFGYALHRVWDMTNGFIYGRHFTFWKAEDIWINEGNGLAGNAVNQIGDIFLKGVTVWSNPNEVGKVSIYDNL